MTTRAAALAFGVAVAWTAPSSASPAERYRERYQSGGREMGRLRFDGIEVIPLGEDAALARGAFRLAMRDGQEPHGLFTLLLRRLDGAWRIVHDHTSSGE